MNPPLVDSPWVSGSPDALIGFVLTGGFGPDILMARFDFLGDAELAALLTYVRQTFAAIEVPIAPEQVTAVRAQLQ
jgi:mono/diheme cytochrome c family protein